MKAVLFLIAGAALAATNTITVTNQSGSTQNARPMRISRFFKRAEFAAGSYPRPSIAGTPLGEWQTNVLTTWPDGSVQHAIIAFVMDLPAEGPAQVDFVLAADPCHLGNQSACDAAAPTRQQILDFGSGTWDGTMSFTAPGSGVTYTRSARAILADTNFNDYRFWLKGPILNEIIVEDRSDQRRHDFGWTCTGASQGDCYGGTWGVASSDSYKAIHPIFIIQQFTGWSGVRVEFIVENSWDDRRATQQYYGTLTTGTAPSTRLTIPEVPSAAIASWTADTYRYKISVVGNVPTIGDGFLSILDCGTNPVNGVFQPATQTYDGGTNRTTMRVLKPGGCSGAGTTLSASAPRVSTFVHPGLRRWRKVYWHGSAPKAVNVNLNPDYMKESGAIPNYASYATPTPGDITSRVTAWDTTADKGPNSCNLMSACEWTNTHEAGLIEREIAMYLLTFDYDLGRAVLGREEKGLGEGYVQAQSWFGRSIREGARISNYCSGSSSACYTDRSPAQRPANPPASGISGDDAGDSDDPFGRPISIVHRQQALLRDLSSGLPATIFSPGMGGYSYSGDSGHFRELTYPAYLVTGDYYWLEEMQFMAAHEAASTSPGVQLNSSRNLNWGIFGNAALQPRGVGLAIAFVGHAAALSPDGSPEKYYFDQIMRVNVAAKEAMLDVTNHFWDGTCTTGTVSGGGYVNTGFDGAAEQSIGCYERFENWNATTTVAAGTYNMGPNPMGFLESVLSGWSNPGSTLAFEATPAQTFIELTSNVTNDGRFLTDNGERMQCDLHSTTLGTALSDSDVNVDLTSNVMYPSRFQIESEILACQNPLATSTLATSITTTDTTIVLTSDIGVGGRVYANGENMLCSNYDPGTFTLSGCIRGVNGTTKRNINAGATFISLVLRNCTRGAEGTTAATHTAGKSATDLTLNNCIRGQSPGIAAATQPAGAGIYWMPNTTTDSRVARATGGPFGHHRQPIAWNHVLDLGLDYVSEVARESGKLARLASNYSSVTRFSIGGLYQHGFCDRQFSPIAANGFRFIQSMDRYDATVFGSGRTAIPDIPSQDMDNSYVAHMIADLSSGTQFSGGRRAWETYHDWFVASGGPLKCTANPKWCFEPRVMGTKITTNALADGSAGKAYQESLSVTGCESCIWTASGLPPGVSINSSTGALTGTPAVAAVHAPTVKATSSQGWVDERTYSLTITGADSNPDPLQITTASLGDGTLGLLYSQDLSSSGGVQPYRWSVLSGALCAGLSMSAAGTLKGLPTVAGTCTFEVGVQDSQTPPRTASLEFILSVKPKEMPPASAGLRGTSRLGQGKASLR